MMKTNKASRIISMILAIAMVFTMTISPSFATEGGEEPAEDKEVNLLVVGSSTSSGYGMPDFKNTNNGFASNNNYLEKWALEADDTTLDQVMKETYGVDGGWTQEEEWTLKAAEDWNSGHTSLARMSNSAFPWQLKKYIASQDGVSKVNLTPITMNGLRTDELRVFLNKDFYEKAYAREAKYAQQYVDDNHLTGDAANPDRYRGFLRSHVDWYMNNFRDSGVIDFNNDAPQEEKYEKASAFVQDSVKNADVIVLDVCGNNFGTYVGYRMNASLGRSDRYCSNTYETIDDVEGLPESTKNTIKSLVGTVAGRLDNPMVEQLINAYLYGVADSIVNFSADIELIRELNPDAKIIAVGLNNPMDGLKIQMGDQLIDIGKVTGTLFSFVNTYMKTLDKNANKYYYASIPSNTTSFASTIAEADSLEDLQKDGEYKDGLGAYAIERIFTEFVNDFMKAENEPVDHAIERNAGDVYSGIQQGVQKTINEKAGPIATEASFPEFDELHDDDAITFGLTYYVTYDGTNPGFTKSADDPTVLTNSAIIDMMKAAPGVDDATANGMAKAYYEGAIATKVQEGIDEAAGALATTAILPEWDEMEADTKISFTLKYYLTYNSDEAELENAISFDKETPDSPLTKGAIRTIFTNAVQSTLYEAVHEHQTIDIGGLISTLTEADGMSRAGESVANYIAAKIQGDEELIEAADPGAVWGLLTIEERFLLSDGVGEHPSAKGCNQKFEAVKKAYESEETAYEVSKEEIMQMLLELKSMLDGTPAGEDLDEIIAKLEKIEAALPMLDEAQMTLEEINMIKEMFNEYYGQALDLLGITEEDLINQGKFIAENVDWEQVAEWIKKMDEIVRQYPELREKYGPQIREYAEKIYDFVDKAMDEIIKASDKIDVEKIAEYIQTVQDIVDQIKDVIKNAPSEEEIMEQLEELQKILEEKVKEISADLYEQLKDINEKLKEAVDGKTYEELLEELKPIMDQIKDMGIAIYKLPEYEKIVDEYAEILAQLGNESAELKDEVSALQQQLEELMQQAKEDDDTIALLTAKLIRVKFTSKVTFPSGKAKLVVSWEKDPDAAGYELKVNGKEAAAKETDTGFEYAVEKAKIGETYKFEVTPYVAYEGNNVYGKTYKTSVVPKVKVKKAALKKVTPSSKALKLKWKKVSGASGYQVSYKLGKKTQYKTVKGGKKASFKIKKLTSGKKYTVKVRAWKKVNGKKYYGKWSKAKKATAK